MMSNERLATTDYTSGIERRRRTVEFNRRITQEEGADFKKRGGEEVLLYSEAPGIVNWALELSSDEVTSIIKKMPERVRKANLEAARFNNPLLDWMLHCLIPDPQAKTNVGTKREYKDPSGELFFKSHAQWLYPNYLTWCKESGREHVSSQRFGFAVIDAAATYGVQTKKKRESDGVKIYGLRFRAKHEKSWLDAIENEGQGMTCMKDNQLKMKAMKDMKTSTSDPDKEKVVSPVFNWEGMGDVF
jgi:putative DNA primase/helicase